jgi:hypothetical protein
MNVYKHARTLFSTHTRHAEAQCGCNDAASFSHSISCALAASLRSVAPVHAQNVAAAAVVCAHMRLEAVHTQVECIV